MSAATLMTGFALLLMWLLASGTLLAAYHRRLLLAWWHEPVLRRPVLIFESDDWGPGDDVHARALHNLADVLAAYRDSDGRHPVATLGIVLALADTARIRETEINAYFRRSLAEYTSVLAAMLTGVERGVFALQLHGLEHYWAPSLLALAKCDSQLKDWLTTPGLPRTEMLPPALQSRWIDAVSLPSRPLSDDEIEAAVSEEVAAFRAIFHVTPTVVVPPTFVWTPAVERAWARHGIRYLVTPGRRYGARDGHGRPVAEGALVNGGHGEAGMMYLVRDDYFEPARGHTAARGLQALQMKTRLGRPALLEMHRFNFIDEPAVAEHASDEIRALLDAALAAYPAVAFLSSEALGRCLEKRDPLWVEQDHHRRLGMWAARVRAHHGLWRWSRLTGLGLAVWVLWIFCARGQDGAGGKS